MPWMVARSWPASPHLPAQTSPDSALSKPISVVSSGRKPPGKQQRAGLSLARVVEWWIGLRVGQHLNEKTCIRRRTGRWAVSYNMWTK